MIRTVREGVQGGILILLPRLHDDRLSKKQQSDIAAAVTVSTRALLEIPPDNIVPEASRAAMASVLQAQVAVVAAIEAQVTGFEPWELYNASDLWNDAAGAIAEGVATFNSTLNPF